MKPNFKILAWHERETRSGTSHAAGVVLIDGKRHKVSGVWEEGDFILRKVSPKITKSLREQLREFIQEKEFGYYAGL
jgi:hypothetical protein